jgi:hypothetical protein
MSLTGLRLFDRLSSVLKRLTLDTDLNEEEGAALAKVTDEVNEVRDKYTDRKVEEVCEQPGR